MDSYILNQVTENFFISSALLFILGAASLVFGIFSKRMNEWFDKKFPASELDKSLISPDGRVFIRRYLSSMWFIFMGAVLIFFAIVNYMYQ